MGSHLTLCMHPFSQDYHEAIYLYTVHKFDFAVWMVAFLGTMFLGVEVGLGIAVAVSLLIVVYEAVYPHAALLGRLPGTSLYRNIKQYPDTEQYNGLVIVRVDGPMYFANANSIRDKVRKYKALAMADLSERKAGLVQYIILDLSPVLHIDTTALHVLEDMYKTQKALGVQLCLCNPCMAVTERLVKSGVFDLVGRRRIFTAVIDAVHWCLNDMDQSSGFVLKKEDISSCMQLEDESAMTEKIQPDYTLNNSADHDTNMEEASINDAEDVVAVDDVENPSTGVPHKHE